jgi:hypothetical protein
MLDRPHVRACLALLLAFLVPACGGGASSPSSDTPFVATYPGDGPGGGPGEPGDSTPPPPSSLAPLFDPDAWTHERTALFGSFPSDLVRHGLTAFSNDADQIEEEGARIVPLDVSGPVPTASRNLLPVTLEASDLRDSHGAPGVLANPIGFGFFLGDIEIVSDELGFVLVNAGGSDSDPALSNLVAFDPTRGTVLQTVDLAFLQPAQGATDSHGNAVPLAGFRQAGAEALHYVATGPDRGRLYVAMSNFRIAAPSYGAWKYPGTVQIYDVEPGSAQPVRSRPQNGPSTQTILLDGYNPVALQTIVAEGPNLRLLVTVAGTTETDDTLALVPNTPASLQVFDALTAAYLGRFDLGLAGLAATRPALGLDGVGHRVGFFPSAVTGEVYLARLDGVFADPVDEGRIAVLRGPANGIPIAADDAGGPGGNVTAVGLIDGGRWLVVAGFGDLFAYPAPTPGRLYLLRLPPDLVTGSGFGTNFVPGWTRLDTLPGRAPGAMVTLPPGQGRPHVLLSVSGALDLDTYAGATPASVGALWLRGFAD